MSLAIYMDHHVNFAITAGLRLRGVDVLTCAEDGMAKADDDQILLRATELKRLAFTQDSDFLALADAWLENGKDFFGIIYSQQAATNVSEAIRDLELIAKALEPADMRNRIEFIPY